MVNYRNELIGRTEHLPKGYYWGCYTDINPNAWKFDVWAISKDEFDEKEKAIHDLKSQIDVVQRKATSPRRELHRLGNRYALHTTKSTAELSAVLFRCLAAFYSPSAFRPKYHPHWRA